VTKLRGGRRDGVGATLRVLPDLEDDLLVELFHKGAKAQWTSRDLDWEPTLQLAPNEQAALARLLTPVYFGEQTAMAGASRTLPELMYAGETTAQVYLSSFIMDEARHFEALTRLYRKLRCDPLGLRELPELLRYFHRLRQGDRLDWAWGILFTDVNAKHFFRALGHLRGDPLLGLLSTQILRDESRHLAFAEHYLRRNLARTDSARRRALLDTRDDLFRLLQSMTERVRADTETLGLDADSYLDNVWTDIEKFGHRIGLTASTDPPPPGDSSHRLSPVRGVEPPTLAQPRTPPTESLPTCFGCLLTLLCQRLVLA
jgi:hypothetical protein